jgi:DNA-binding response OmpR family regulator
MPLRILMVDDDKDSLDLISYMLEQSEIECEVVTESNTRKALGLIRAEAFDCYILNYFLKDVSGADICRAIRRTGSASPIVFFTGMEHKTEVAQMLAAGADEVLIKASDVEILVSTVERLCTAPLT